MNKIISIICLGVAVNATIDNVEEITYDNYFSKVIDQQTGLAHDGDPWFLFFYAPWCGGCKQTFPEFYKVAARNPRVRFGQINCTEYDSRLLCNKKYSHFDIHSFPTMYYIPTRVEAIKGKEANLYYENTEYAADKMEKFACNGGWTKVDSRELPKIDMMLF